MCETSVVSFVKRRIEAFEFDTRVVGGEVPVDLGSDPVSGGLPSADFGSQGVDGVDAAVEALADRHAEFDLGDVQPTAVLGGVDELEAVPQRLGPCRVEGLVEGSGRWVLRLSITNVMRAASGYCPAMSSRKRAQSVLVLRSMTLVRRRPASGSVAMNTLHVPRRRYS